MSKVLLINPSYLRTYGGTQAGIANPVFPILSLAALGGVAKSKGHEAQILDLSYRSYDPQMLRELITREKPDIVGITSTTPLMNQARDLSFLVKDISKDILTLSGGAHPSALPRETLQESAFDALVVGEGDLTFGDILDGKPLPEVPGIYWRNGDQIVANATRPLVSFLDDLPVPAWELYSSDSKRRVTRYLARYSPVTTVEFSRGCVFKCDFCATKNTVGEGYRKKSPERCAEELEYLVKLGYREFILADDIFTSDNNWALQVCEEISRRNIKLAWTCTNGIRVDSANEKLFKAMRRAGCYRVHFGFESGNDAVLKAFGKGGRASLEQGQRAVTLAREAGLETWGMFQVGLSADTVDTMKDTVRFAQGLDVDIKRLGITVPFPGTPMFKNLAKMGNIKTLDWDDFNVFNEATQIYNHPTLSWDVLLKFYKKAYMKLYYLSPKYIFRRLWRGLWSGDAFMDITFGLRFLFILLGGKQEVPPENYAYADKWRPLDVKLNGMGEYQHQKATGLTWRRTKTTADGGEVAVTSLQQSGSTA
jgi:anaerobic magnesium-protoporphyrin IX monomethyl ester cyclase